MTADNVHGAKETETRLSSLVGSNLRRLRQARGFSLERLAGFSGVSRAMLGQIETGRSAPTINLLGRIADALSVSIQTLVTSPEKSGTIVIKRNEYPSVNSTHGRLLCRVVLPGEGQRADLYELVLPAMDGEASVSYEFGVRKSLSVVTGRVEVTVGIDLPVILEAGDSILFSGDSAHVFRNPDATEAKAFLLVAQADSVHFAGD